MTNGTIEMEDYLADICNFDGLEAYLPLGAVALPAGFGVTPDPTVKFLLVKDTPEGFVAVDEAVVKMAESLSPKGKLWFKCANGGLYDRATFIQMFGKDPLLVLGWMRRHKGVWTPAGRVTIYGGIAEEAPPGYIKLGGKGGVTTPYPQARPGPEIRVYKKLGRV